MNLRDISGKAPYQKSVLFPFLSPREGGKPLSLPHRPHLLAWRSAVPGPCGMAASSPAPCQHDKVLAGSAAASASVPGIGCAVPWKRCSLIINCGLSIQGADNGISQAPLHGRGGHHSRHGVLFNYCAVESVLEKRIENYTKF